MVEDERQKRSSLDRVRLRDLFFGTLPFTRTAGEAW